MTRRACAAMSARPAQRPKPYIHGSGAHRNLMFEPLLKLPLTPIKKLFKTVQFSVRRREPYIHGFTSPKSLDRVLEFLFYLGGRGVCWILFRTFCSKHSAGKRFGVNPTP